MEKAANIRKTLTETEKNTVEAETFRSTLRQEALKSWAQILVPLISVLTLGFTLLTQVLQQKAAQEAQEDTAWRQAIAKFSSVKRHGAGFEGLALQVELKPFIKSGRHKEEAAELARLMLPELADAAAFKDLFETLEWRTQDEVAEVLRNLTQVLGDTLKGLSAAKKFGSSDFSGGQG